MTAVQIPPHLEALEELLKPHRVTLMEVLAETLEGCGTSNTDDMLVTAVQLLSQKLTAQQQAQQHLVQQHDELRLRCARKEANLHRAHDVVGKAALTYHDEGLARLARDHLHGRPYREALDALPTAHALLKLGQQQLVG